MYTHDKRLQFEAKPDRPDPVLARRMQELIGGQYGEITVMMQYQFQGWNCRHPGKYKDLIMDTGTEEIGHVEMLATMVARLVEGAPVEHATGQPLPLPDRQIRRLDRKRSQTCRPPLDRRGVQGRRLADQQAD